MTSCVSGRSIVMKREKADELACCCESKEHKKRPFDVFLDTRSEEEKGLLYMMNLPSYCIPFLVGNTLTLRQRKRALMLAHSKTVKGFFVPSYVTVSNKTKQNVKLAIYQTAFFIKNTVCSVCFEYIFVLLENIALRPKTAPNCLLL